MIHDAHLNAEKNGPLPVAEYSVLLMFSTEGKCYSISEMEDMLSETGFSEISQGKISVITCYHRMPLRSGITPTIYTSAKIGNG